MFLSTCWPISFHFIFMTLGLSLSPEIQMFSEVFKGVPMGRSGLMIPAYKNTLPNTHTHTQHNTVASTRKWNDIHDIALEKQTSRGILIRRCCENMKLTYRRTPMSKWDYNKAALHLYWNNTSAWVLSCKLTAYFQNTSLKNSYGGLLLPLKSFTKPWPSKHAIFKTLWISLFCPYRMAATGFKIQ